MTWHSLKERLDELPLVLCGPILRRVDRRSVTVWVVTSRECSVRLVVEQLAAGIPGFQGQATTRRFGIHVWIAVVQATSEVNLPWQSLFAYDLEFTPTVGGGPLTFEAALGGAQNLSALTYGELNLPTFVTPPSRARDLRILYGSCRKPHGLGRDALPLVDTCLDSRATDLAMRPCQLYMTGDQIYADDVADQLLFLLRDAASALVGYNEVLPGVADAAELSPGKRAILSVQAGLTASLVEPNIAKSHLMTLAEYLMMYLFTWSDVLWPPAGGWPGAQLIGAAGEVFDTEVRSIRAFQAGLAKVRRALANISTYMIFDDHDVTDDWNIFRDWARAVYGGAGFAENSPVGRRAAKTFGEGKTQPRARLGRRIVLNGLSAYAVCQAWGNEPTKFSGGNGKALLDVVSGWSEGNPVALAAAEEILLPTAANPVAGADLPRPAKPVGWSFTLSYPDCDWETVFLDNRTLRSWPGASDDEPLPTPAALATGGRLLDQFQIAGRPYLVVISPAPVFGLHTVERAQKEIAQNVSRRLSLYGSYWMDYEAWIANPSAMHFLLLSLAEATASPGAVPPRAVALLSGDVHHGFTFRLRYRRADQARKLVLCQCTSSPFKNRAETKRGGLFFDYMASFERLAADPNGVLVWTWMTPGGAVGGVGERDEIPPATLPDPTWRGRLQALKDSRTDILADPIGVVVREVGEAIGATKFLATDCNRVVVAPNHLGELYFGVAGGEVVSIVQGLYVDGADVGRGAGLLIQTQHVASLDPDVPAGAD